MASNLSDGRKFVEDTKLEETVEHRTTTTEGPKQAVEMSSQKPYRVQQSKCVILYLGWRNPIQQYRLFTTRLAGSDGQHVEHEPSSVSL